MSMVNIAQRVHNHNYKLDPIVRSLLDTDFYKLLMMQFIFKHYKDIPVTFAMKNRTKSVNLHTSITYADLRAQLDYVKNLRFTNTELIWLQGNTFYGKKGMFEPEFIEALRDFKLPDYKLDGSFNTEDNEAIHLEFTGTWFEVTLWEIYALSIVNELRNRRAMQHMSEFEIDVMYARAKTKLWDKFRKLQNLDGLNLTDFGTRRRHSFLWQEWAVTAAKAALGDKFTGTSNAYLAMKHNLEAKGTNAHELPMVLAALAKTDEQLKQSQYDVLIKWANTYDGALLIALPDTFGTTQFLQDAPEWLNDWTGFRYDSKDPVTAGYETIDWWKSRGVDPRTKLGLFSDGLDVDNIVDLQNEFRGKMRVGFGWGTLLTNDFRGCHPNEKLEADLAPISLVCKVKEADGHHAVKLSDNYTKATGLPEDVARYREVFGAAGVKNAPVVV
jgi:nicotinate phosphoribosyltransferase